MVPLAFGAGSAAMRVLLQRAPRSIAVDLAQPLPVVTAWHAFGSAAFAILAFTIALATLGLLVAAPRFARGAAGRDGLLVVAIAALALLAAGSWPVVFSSDVYAYAAYGALAAAGHDPYAALAPSVSGPFVEAARWQWSGPFPRCVYGPLFVALARGEVALFGAAGVAATLTALRVSAGAAFLGSILLLDSALGERVPAASRRLALCAYGLNPVALWTVAEGHNDAFVMLVVTAGAAAAARGARFAGPLLAALAPVLKAPGLLLAAVAACGVVAFRVPERGRILAGVGLGTVLAAGIALPPLLPALGALGKHGRYAPQVSAQGLLGLGPALVLAALAAGYGVLLLRGGRRSGFAWLGIGVLLALPNPYPWYAPWLVPLALAAGAGASGVALWAATISAVVRYLPDAAGGLDAGTARLAALFAALPLLWAVAGARRLVFARKKVIPQP
jgi:hypothetical protein